MSNREIKGNNGWVENHSAVDSKLHRKGYSVGGYIDKGVPKYVLYRTGYEQGRFNFERGRFNFERVHEFDTPEELNMMVKLLIEEGE